MNEIVKRVFVAGLLILAFVSFGCAGMGTTGQTSSDQPPWDYNGDVYSPYPPYHRPTH